jgi:hypothetical protein
MPASHNHGSDVLVFEFLDPEGIPEVVDKKDQNEKKRDFERSNDF